MSTIVTSISAKLLESKNSNLVRGFVLEVSVAGAQIILPKSGRRLGHVTPTNFLHMIEHISKLLELETSNLVHGFVGVGPP